MVKTASNAKKEKVVKPKKEKKVTGNLVKRIEGIFRYLESLDRTNKATLEQNKKDYELQLQGFALREKESAVFIEKLNLQIERLKKDNKNLV